MIEKNRTSERLLPWLRLGEAAYMLSFKRNPGRIYSRFAHAPHQNAKQLAESVGRRLGELEDIVYNGEHSSRLKVMLHLWDDRDASQLLLKCIALVCWMRLCAVHPDTSVNMVAQVLADSIGVPRPEAILQARKAVMICCGFKTLQLVEGEVLLGAGLANFLCDNDPVLLEPLVKKASADPSVFAESASQKSDKKTTPAHDLKEFVKKLELIRPADLEKRIVAEGYVGQERARRAVCISAYRHVKRLRNIYLEGKDPKTLPKRDCLLMIGQTGCGKTHLCEIIFERLLKLPFLIWNTANLTDAGYVGGKIEHLLVRLYQAAGNSVPVAQLGVIVLDEIDKIASSQTGAMPGDRLSRDVSGDASQKVLLKLLEGGVLSVPNYGRDMSAWEFNARDTMIVGAGAFSALHLQKNRPTRLGFGLEESPGLAGRLGTDELTRYGMQEEFIGRFTNIVTLDPLGRNDLRAILARNLATRFQNELLQDGVAFSLDCAVVDLLVQQALERKTGARGLTTCLSDVLQDALFEVYSSDGVNELRLICEGKQMGYEVIGRGGKRTSIPVKASPTILAPDSAVGLSGA